MRRRNRVCSPKGGKRTRGPEKKKSGPRPGLSEKTRVFLSADRFPLNNGERERRGTGKGRKGVHGLSPYRGKPCFQKKKVLRDRRRFPERGKKKKGNLRVRGGVLLKKERRLRLHHKRKSVDTLTPTPKIGGEEPFLLNKGKELGEHLSKERRPDLLVAILPRKRKGPSHFLLPLLRRGGGGNSAYAATPAFNDIEKEGGGGCRFPKGREYIPSFTLTSENGEKNPPTDGRKHPFVSSALFLEKTGRKGIPDPFSLPYLKR